MADPTPDDVVGEVQVDDVPCICGELITPGPGAWTALVVVQGNVSQFSPGQQVTLTMNGVSRVGTVNLGDDPDQKYFLRLVGGADKMDEVLDPTDYTGHSLDQIVADILEDAGETVGDLSALSTVTPQYWVRQQGPARRALQHALRLAPAGVYVRVDFDGSWVAVKPDWSVVGGPVDAKRVESFPAEDACMLYADTELNPDPLTSISFLGVNRKIDRCQYTWAQDQMRVLVWFRRDDFVGEDRAYESIKAIVLRVLSEANEINFRGTYSARVSADSSGPVDVFFEDDLQRIRFVKSAKIYSEVGQTVTLAKGTRVILGWLNGDERYPYVLASDWIDKAGGLKTLQTTADTSLTYKAPQVNLGDVASGCDPVMTASDGANVMVAIAAAITALGALNPFAAPLAALQTALANLGWAAGSGPPAAGLGSPIVGAKRTP